MASKKNIGHKHRLTHAEKRKMATRLTTKEEHYSGIFQSLGWRKRKWAIMQRVRRHNIIAKYHSEIRQGVR